MAGIYPNKKARPSCASLTPPRDEIEDEHNEGDHQKQVDQASAHMSEETEQPKNDQNDHNGVQHDEFLLEGVNRNRRLTLPERSEMQ
jgi:hypothetical protein